MSLSTRLARALVPAIIIAAPVAAYAKASPDMALVKAHLQATDSMTANFTQTDSKGQVLNGTLQLKRPGRIRFDYGRTNILVVAEGK
jgi:outer membrane lipoprotein-sorting protein